MGVNVPLIAKPYGLSSRKSANWEGEFSWLTKEESMTWEDEASYWLSL